MNNTLIGLDAGIELTDESNITIIGDGIKNIDEGQKDVFYFTDKILIGKTVFGEKCNLYDIFETHIKKIN